jgi:hypothetical protein
MATEQAAENYTVEDLVALNPYNPDILNDLEKFVNEQVSPIPWRLLSLFISFVWILVLSLVVLEPFSYTRLSGGEILRLVGC